MLGAEEVTGDELAGGLRLQWAAEAEFPDFVRLFELDCCAIPRTATEGGGKVEVLLTGGPSRAAHHLDFCVITFKEITADIERRLPHIPSFVQAAVWDERCGGVEIFLLSPLLFPRCAASALELRGCRGRQKDSEAFGSTRGCGPFSEAPESGAMLAHAEGFAGRLAALEVSGAAPIPTPCSSGPSMLGLRAASRKSGSPALHEARTLLGARAGISRIRLHVKPVCAVPSKKRCAFQPKSASVLDKPRSARSLEKFGADAGVATTEAEHTEVLNGGGS